MSRSESLGKPALEIAGFQLWIHGREYPNSHDADDYDWLRVTAHCGRHGADVWTQGSLLMVSDIDKFQIQLKGLLEQREDTAVLDPLEPELRISIEPTDSLGHFLAIVEITPNPMTQNHRFEFEIDQSYIPGMIAECETITKKSPVRK